MDSIVYMDYAASTPCDPRVVDAMLPFFTERYANESNIAHLLGREAHKWVEIARDQVSTFLNCLSQQIIWTSGATESNNLALQGSISASVREYPNKKKHIITSSIEHKSVLETCKYLESRGIEVTYIKPERSGVTDPERIKNAIKSNTILVSIMIANNEIGTINEVDSISNICQRNNILFHTDATQYIGKYPIDLKQVEVDLMSFSGHKIYACKGIGGLYVKNSSIIQPLVFGGGHEQGFRSGTLNVPGIIAIGKACEILSGLQIEEKIKIENLRDMLESIFLNFNEKIIINGKRVNRVPNISSISFPVKEGYNIMDNINLVACSSGSACDTPDNLPSHVMLELGKSRHAAKNTLRFSIGRFSTESDIIRATDHIIKILKRIC